MSSSNAIFSGPLIVEDDNDGLWTIMQAFTFFPIGYSQVSIPVGFVTDFFSIPAVVRGIFAKSEEKGNQAAVCHDYIYQQRKDPTFVGLKRSRKECDDILMQGMVCLGVAWWKRQVIYWAVRSFGWAY